MGSSLSLSVCLLWGLGAQVPEPEEDPREIAAEWESSMAERMAGAPNPYKPHASPRPAPPPRTDDPWIQPWSPPPTEREYFEMEDSADWMGIQVSSVVLAGLEVEFAGPAEEPKRQRVMTNLKYDPFHPTYVQTTVGFRIRF